MNEDIVTISYQNGRYEVFDHTNRSTIVGCMIYGKGSKDLTRYDAIEIANDIVKRYDSKRLGEK